MELNVIKNYLEYMKSIIQMDTWFEIDSKQTKEFYEFINKLVKENEKLQKEIDFYKKEELGDIAGYEDGKRHKQTAVAIKNENAQQELIEEDGDHIPRID